MKKYLNIKSGFIRSKKGLEINWSIYEWALPLSVDFSSEYLIFIRLFCVSLIVRLKMDKTEVLKKCIECYADTKVVELEENAQYLSYGKRPICNKCATRIDNQIDAHVENK